MRPLFAVGTLVLSLALSACGGGNSHNEPEQTRAQDARVFTVAPVTGYADYQAGPGGRASFTAQAGQTVATHRWAGTLNGAAYRIEMPTEGWNGMLVMYAHGYRGTGAEVTVSNPSIRRYLISNGYAWAASSYTKNYYDVRAGVEDTNALALNFTAIAATNGVVLTPPTKTYITGHSMGGHIAAAAVETETLRTTNNRVRYAGSVPMCGVVGDTKLFDTFGAMQMAAQALTGQPNVPMAQWATIQPAVTSALFTTFPSVRTPLGEQYASVVKNLTGGERPLFTLAMNIGGSFASPYGSFGGDGTINGILNSAYIDTRDVVYVIDGNSAASAALNATAQDLVPTLNANRERRDGLRWIPAVNGDIANVPVVTIHTIGDLFVPFSMEQIYAQRAAGMQKSSWLKQRAIRGISHCDFTVAEQERAFDDMIRWERDGVVPTGDDVLTPATVAAANYGCRFTNNALGADDSASVRTLRGAIANAGGSCAP